MAETTNIYLLHSPEDPSQSIYIGKADDLRIRLRQHAQEALKTKKSTRKLNWLRKWLPSLEAQIEIVLLETVATDGWQESERFYIAYFHSIGANVLNTTDGGDGLSDPTGEIGKKISLTLKGRKHPCSPETARKISAAKKGCCPPNTHTPQANAKRSAWMRGHIRSPEHRKKISENKKFYWANRRMNHGR